MKERPILFNAEMVRAILDGRKTQTRRVIKPQPDSDPEGWLSGPFEVGWSETTVVDKWGEEQPSGKPTYGMWECDGEWSIRCPYGGPGDRLWVRETWQRVADVRPAGRGWESNGEFVVVYRATEPKEANTWESPTHMPRALSRILLEITGVRVERVQDISEADALAEGVTLRGTTRWHGQAESAFAALWDRINAKREYGWTANPWVWVIEFRKVAPEDAAC